MQGTEPTNSYTSHSIYVLPSHLPSVFMSSNAPSMTPSISHPSNIPSISNAPSMTPSILHPSKSPSIFGTIIPLLIHQTWECEKLPIRYHKSVRSWKSLNPEYKYKLWTQPMCRSFIREFLGHDKLQLYDQLLPGAYRADLFRAIILFFQGGFYADVDSTLYVPLSTLNKNVSFITARDLGKDKKYMLST